MTLTASFNLSANKKKAAAYSKELLIFVGYISLSYLPNLCLPSKANAFFDAALCQRGSLKSFAKNFFMTVCSLWVVAVFHNPWSKFFLRKAK